MQNAKIGKGHNSDKIKSIFFSSDLLLDPNKLTKI